MPCARRSCAPRTRRCRRSSRPMPAPARRMCSSTASSACCSTARRPRKSSASPSPRRPPPTWPSACSTPSGTGFRWTTRSWTQHSSWPACRIRTPSCAARARELFSCALETPGGLKVQTIHALCTRLLQQFPFEANVPARFTVLDDRDQFEIMERSILSVLLDAAAKPQSDIGKALDHGDHQFRRPDVSRRHPGCLPRQHRLPGMDRRKPAGAGAAMRSSTRRSACKASEQLADVEREIVDGPHLPIRRWAAIAAVLDGGSASDQKQAETLRAALALTGTAQVEEYLGLFLTQAKEFRNRSSPRTSRQPPGRCRAHSTTKQPRLQLLIEKRRARGDRRAQPRAAPHRLRGRRRTIAARSRSAACSTTTT